VVLILGRFTSERLTVLEAVRTLLRQHDYVPILFNFEGPENLNVRATVETVARLARFVVDLTDVKAVDQELQAIVPQIKVPIRPLLLEGTEPPGPVLQTLWHDYPDRLLKIHRYYDLDELLASFKEKVIDPAEAGREGIEAARARGHLRVTALLPTSCYPGEDNHGPGSFLHKVSRVLYSA
jgi:hypothetical protein